MDSEQYLDSVNESAKSSVIQQNDRPSTEREPVSTKQPNSGRWRGVSLGLTLLVLLAGGGFAWQWWQTKGTSNPASAQPSRPRGIPVKLEVVGTSTLQDTSEFVGTLEAQRSLPLRPEIDGRLSELFVKPGDTVRAGEIIARMESDELRAQLVQAKANLVGAQARLQQLRAGSRPEEIAQARARLAQAQARLAEARAGSRPEEIAQARARLAQAQAQLTAAQTSNPQQIAQAEAQVDAAQARVDLASDRLKANQSLAQQGAISQQRLQEIISEYRTTTASLEEAKRRLTEIQKGTSPGEIAQRQAAVREAQQALNLLLKGTRSEEIAQAEAQVVEAQQVLRQLQNGSRPEEIAQAEAQVAQAAAGVRASEVRLEDSSVRAPFAGIVGNIPVKRGEYLKKGDTLTNLTQNQALDLNLAIPIERQSQLQPGLSVQLTGAKTEAIATGQIGFISPQVNTQSQAILAKATFDNASGQLRDGQFVRAKIIWNSRPNAVVIPTTAIIFQGQERFVYTVSNQPTPQTPSENPPSSSPGLIAKRLPIQLGLIKGDRAEVISGLQPGTQIIVSGTQKLSDGAPIVPLGEEQRGREAISN